jgi:CubicO group peptidase (beta-lactamase class C family)
MRGLPMAALEKQKYMLYNNMMYTVASHLVEVKTGRPFEDFLREKFFRPLGMASTHLHPPSTQGSRDHMASGHQFDKASGNWSVFDIPYAPEAQGAGSIVTSTADYIKWVQAMLHRHAPISEASYKALTQPEVLLDPEDKELDTFCSHQLYCMGWETYHYRGHQVVIHEGLVDGFGSAHFFLPAHGFGAVILGNADGIEQVCWILARELIDAALDVPAAERPDWAAIQAVKLAKGSDAGDPEDQLRELRAESTSGGRSEKPAPALEACVGSYSDAGYGVFKIEIRNGSLFIDAMDRGFKCTFTFEHVRTWDEDGESGGIITRSSMIAHLRPLRGSVDEYLAAELVFAARSWRAVRMAIALDPDTETIWFHRMEEDVLVDMHEKSACL